jgi:hypothetical protein
MKAFTSIRIGCAAALLTVAPAMSAEPNAPTYSVALTVHDGDALIGSPMILVAQNEQASVAVGNPAQERYVISLSLAPQKDGRLSIAQTIEIDSGTTRTRAKAPDLVATLGKPTGLTIFNHPDGAKPFRIDYQVEKAS